MMTWTRRQLQQLLLLMMMLMVSFVVSYDQCPSSCACLGNTVDCSNKQLQDIPADLPSWTEIL